MTEEKTTISVNGFYGNKNKRITSEEGGCAADSLKCLWIEKTIQKTVKKHKEQKIPREFPSRILGPSTSWKTFFRQKDAFDFSRSKAQDLHVFAFESDSYDANTGQRMYLVASYPVFWHYYSQLEEERRHHYEVIPEGAVCKLYFDLEYNITLNPNADGNQMVDLLIKIVCLSLQLEFNLNCSRDDILDLDASTKDKFSRHLIFQFKNAAFKDNIHAGNFVCYIISQIISYRQKVLENGDQTESASDNGIGSLKTEKKTSNTQDVTANNNDLTQTMLETGPDHTGASEADCYELKKDVTANNNDLTQTMSETGQDHTGASEADCYELKNTDTKDSKNKQTTIDERYNSILEDLTKADLESLLVKNKHGDNILFCDLGVYTKNRNFRLYLSSKLKKKNPLVLAIENTHEPSSTEQDIFLRSLVSNVRYSKGSKVLTFEKESNSLISYTRKRTERVDGKDSIEGYSKSPYPEVDDYITSLITLKGNRGGIRHWTYFHQGELLVYEISRYRFCHNIGRQHRSNNIMYIVDLHKGIFYQKCHDPDCHTQNYKSQEWELPKTILPASYFTDDDFDIEMDDQELLDSTLELEQSIHDQSKDMRELDDNDDAGLIQAAEIMDTT